MFQVFINIFVLKRENKNFNKRKPRLLSTETFYFSKSSLHPFVFLNVVHNYFVLSIEKYSIQGNKKEHIRSKWYYPYNQSIKTGLSIPSKLLLLRYNVVSIVKFPICKGILPVRPLSPKLKYCSCLHLNKVDEIVPIKQLPFRNRY
jgi:hypothetical protein